MERLSDDARGSAKRKFRQSGGGAGAEALGELLSDILLLRVVDDVLRLDHLARHVIEAADSVGEPELDALLAGPDEPAEGFLRFLQPLASALANDADELLMDVRRELPGELLMLFLERAERVEKRLVLSSRDEAALDAELLHQAGEAEPVHQDTD